MFCVRMAFVYIPHPSQPQKKTVFLHEHRAYTYSVQRLSYGPWKAVATKRKLNASLVSTHKMERGVYRFEWPAVEWQSSNSQNNNVDWALYGTRHTVNRWAWSRWSQFHFIEKLLRSLGGGGEEKWLPEYSQWAACSRGLMAEPSNEPIDINSHHHSISRCPRSSAPLLLCASASLLLCSLFLLRIIPS